MGKLVVTIGVGDQQGRQFEDLEVTVDTGSTFTAVPRALLQRLGVPVRRSARSRLADGSSVPVDIGWTVVRLEDQTFATQVIFAEENQPSLLGVVTLEDALLAVASVTTGQNDYTQKRDDYAAFGVPEYWRFDPSGGEYHDAPLAGDHLVDGVYQPIEVVQFGETTYRGHSAVLGLDLCWEDGQLRWYDPASGRYLLTYDEEAEGCLQALERVRELEDQVRRLQAG